MLIMRLVSNFCGYSTATILFVLEKTLLSYQFFIYFKALFGGKMLNYDLI